MKKLLALLLALAIVFSLAACAGRPNKNNDDPTDPSNGGSADTPTDPTEVDDGICETAWEAAENMGLGWNLGCSLSVASKTTVSAFSGLIGMHTDDGLYSRSEYLSFNEETNSVTLEWDLGNDNGLLQTYEGALVGEIFVEQWNFALTEADYCTFTVEEFSYTLKSGETVSIDPVTQETDMGGGTGYIPLVETEALNGLKVEDIATMHCVMSYGGMSASEPTPEKIATQETAWGNPVTTQEMIDAVVERGFNTIRIQVSYVNHMDAEGNIDKLWLDRVQEVVDYCMNAGVYCVINTSGAMWMTCNPAEWETQKPVYTNLWAQIAERFADYGEKLIFESCNEVLYVEGLWNYPPMEAYDVMHEIHQTFVDTVRAGGGYNETRNLMLNPYAAGYDYEMNKNFTLPTDTVEGHLMAQVHCYVPQDFTFNETNLGSTNFRYEWGTDEDKKQLDDTLKGIKTRFIDELGIPVVIGEFGVAKRLSEGEAAEYMGFYAKTADKYGIGLILFDDGVDISVFDRSLLIWLRPQVVEALFAKDAPAHEGGGEEENMPVGIPEVEAVTDPMPSWYSRLYFTDSDGTYNTSVTAEFSNGTKKSKLLWVLGKNDTDLKAKDDANVMEIGMDLWNFTLTQKTPVDVEILQLTYYTKNGAVSVPVSPSKMTIELNGGAGAVKLADVSGVKAGDIVAIYLEVKMVVEDTGTSVSGLPHVTPTSNPYGTFQTVAYFATMQTGYNRSDPAVSFDADTKTAEILYIIEDSRAAGFTTAGEDEVIANIGVEIWNFAEDRPKKVSYSVESLKYYTDNGSGMKVHYLNPLKSEFSVKLTYGNAGVKVADVTDPCSVGDMVAIYAKVRLNIADEPEPEKPNTDLPVVEDPTDPMAGWSARNYISASDGTYNTSPLCQFSEATQTAKILWVLAEEGDFTAGPEATLDVLGLDLWNFSLTETTPVTFHINKLTCYTVDGNVVELAPMQKVYNIDMIGGVGAAQLYLGNELQAQAVKAIYTEVVFGQPDVELPTVEDVADPMPGWWVRNYFSGSDGTYNTSDLSAFSTATETAEVLWILGQNDGDFSASPDADVSVIGMDLWNFSLTSATPAPVHIEKLSLYTNDGTVTDVATTQEYYALTVSGGTATTQVYLPEGLKVSDVKAIYMKISFGEAPAELPTVVAPADPMPGWWVRNYFSGSDGTYNTSDLSAFSTATETAEVLWILGQNDGDFSASPDADVSVIGLDLWNFSLTEPTPAPVHVKKLSIYTNDGKVTDVEVTQSVYELTVNGGTANTQLYLPEGLKVADVKAIYMQIAFGEPEAPEVPEVELPTVVAPADPMPGWWVRNYFSGSDGTYNTSALSAFSTATETAEVLWILGENDGELTAAADADVSVIGLDLWNFSLTEPTPAPLHVKKLSIYTNDGKVADVEVTQSVYDLTVNGGTATTQLYLPEGLKVADVKAIYMQIAFGEPEAPEVPEVELPTVVAPADPMPGWWVRNYFSGSDGTYNTSALSAFSTATETAEVLWILGENDGELTAAADADVSVIGLDLWNFSLTEPTPAPIHVKQMSIYTNDGKVTNVEVTQRDYDLTVIGGTATTQLYLPEGLKVADVKAIYMEVKFGENDGPVKVEKLPELTAPESLLPNYHVMPYFATKTAGFNRMDPTAQFDANTNTAQALFVLEASREAGFVTAKEDESILGIGMNFWNFTDVSASFGYTVKELKYYTVDGEGYLEHTIKLEKADFELALAGGSGSNTVLELQEGELIVGDVVAIYAEIQLNFPQVEDVAVDLPEAALVETPDVSLEPEEE